MSAHESISGLLWTDAMREIVRRARERQLARARHETERLLAETPWLREIVDGE